MGDVCDGGRVETRGLTPGEAGGGVRGGLGRGGKAKGGVGRAWVGEASRDARATGRDAHETITRRHKSNRKGSARLAITGQNCTLKQTTQDFSRVSWPGGLLEAPLIWKTSFSKLVPSPKGG